MLQKEHEPSRIFALIQLEKIAEDARRLGGEFKHVRDLIRIKKKTIPEKKGSASPPKLINPSYHSFSKFKVVNRFKVNKSEQIGGPVLKNEQHGIPQKSYQIIIDAKYVKMLDKRSYRTEELYEFFRHLYQVINAILSEFESIPFLDREKIDTQLIQQRLNSSDFSFQSVNASLSDSKNIE